MNQRVKALLDARAPGSCILEFGCTRSACGVAGRALGFVNLFTAAQRTVGIADFHGADFLQAHGLGHFCIGRACAHRVGSGHELHQANDDEDWNDKREEDGKQQMLGVFDGAGMGFFVVLLAHEVL